MPTCNLTGIEGRFVRSHLLPEALTRAAVRGAPLTQFGRGTAPVRRWTSWYDRELVTAEGEAILQTLDGWAISALREKRLLWSGWGPLMSLGSIHEPIPGTPYGIRTISGLNTSRLRIFFLSLLWRAAATGRREFAEVQLRPNELEQLRRMVVSDDPGPFNFYPVTLIQLSSLGEQHNLSPLAQVKEQPAVGDVPAQSIPIFRFYLDGLIAHFDRRPALDVAALGRIFVGPAADFIVTTVTYEASAQLANSEALSAEMLETFGPPRWET